MISTQLTQVQPGDDITLAEMFEAFAFTYLAQYNTGTWPTRVIQAFQKAWNPTTMTQIPGVGGGMPGGVVAIFKEDGAWRMVVAIDGIRNLGQLGSIVDSVAPTGRTGLAGHVPEIYNTFANSFLTALQGNSVINEALTSNRVIKTFCGHSMGAAMAELLATEIKRLHDASRVRLIKFAAPRVGSVRWIERRDSRIKVMTVYNSNDPIHYFPFFARSSIFQAPTNGFAPFICYGQEDSPLRYTPEGGRLSSYSTAPRHNRFSQAAAYLGDPTVPSYWPDHFMDAYRLTLMNYAADKPDLLAYRFNYLEHPDENSWQQDFRQGITLNLLPKEIRDPAPSPASPPSATAAQEAIGGGDFPASEPQGDPFNVDAAAERQPALEAWGVQPILVSQSNTQRRTRTR